MPEILSLLGMLLVVVGVLVLAYFCTRFIGRHGMPGAFRGGINGQELGILWQQSLGKDQHLVLLKLHGRCLLLGSAQGGIRVLAELSEEEAKKWLEKPPAPAAQMPDFAQVLRGRLTKKK